ncbi:MAG: glutamine-hydrolyzing carbamoyl-phosphate synthase small subunit [Candidatus Aminicenantes bacterium]|nr:glutamine-hydrolyzing carbamoyl-phosphate synthase small subunit [Candidatus Aminicenantes bacterium]
MQHGTLILEDGTEFRGTSFGTILSNSGEVVFNTGMVGYNESLTDPSYKGQILVFTYPLIGNYGVPSQEITENISKYFESQNIQVSGLVVSDYSNHYHHGNAVKSLSKWLKKENIPALTGIDTRTLTKRLRERGTMLGKIVFKKDVDFFDPNKEDLVKKVSVTKPEEYNPSGVIKLVVIDCGVKNNILRSLIRRNCHVLRVPYDYDFFSHSFDGVIISNGPGNPKTYQPVIENIKKCIDIEIPVFGICLGNQILGLAAGADTFKLKYGHRSQNQPCLLKGTRRCYITSQNHGFSVDSDTLPKEWIPWFININDQTNEGIKHRELPFMSVQFHPEHSPGPVDTEFIFDEFLGGLVP